MRIGVVLIAVALLASSCGGDDGSPDETNANALVVTREDGTKIDFAVKVRAWCGPKTDVDSDADIDPAEKTLHVIGGDLPQEDDEQPKSFWLYSRAVDDVQRDPKVTLPEEGSGSLFIYDEEFENELSASDELSSGSVAVEEHGCEKGDAVRITVDATIGSEFFDGSPVDAAGEIVAVIGDPVALED